MSVNPSPDNHQTPNTPGQSPTERRREHLRDAFFPEFERTVEVGRQQQPGLITLIASYDDKNPASVPLARQNTLAKSVQVLAGQLRYLSPRVRENFHIVIANNGMSPSQLEAIHGTVNAINKNLLRSGEPEINLHIAYAPKNPSDPKTWTAAYSRNKGLADIRDKRRDDPAFGAPVLVADDDAVVEGIVSLLQALTTGPGKIGAVAPLNRTTDNVILKGDELLKELASGQHEPPQTPAIRPFPGIMNLHGMIDFCTLTAFGGTRVPKTCALMIDGYAVQSIQNSKGELFIAFPEGSFEDMALSGALERRGYSIVECRDAEVHDQVRVDPRARALQQFRWAYDHGFAYEEFILIGRREKQALVFEGITVLTPTQGQWTLTSIPSNSPSVIQALNTRGVHASVVNPAEVLELLSRIEISLAVDPGAFVAKHPYAFDGREGSFKDIDVLKKTVKLCTDLLHSVAPLTRQCEPQLVGVPVTPIHQLSVPDRLRFEDDVRVARLLGNLAATAHMTSNDVEGGKLRVALLGPRQATR